MASLHYRLSAALLAVGLIGGCGGDRSRAGAGADTTTAAVATPDSAAMPVTDTGAAARRDTTPPAAADAGAKAPTAGAADTGAKQSAAARREARKPAPQARATHDTTTAPGVQATRDTTRVVKAESTQGAPTPAAQPQDTSKAQAPAAEAPLRDAYHQAPRDTVTQAVYNGWKQFNLNCARCHGEDVLGTTIAPHLIMSLKPDGPINSKELFVQTVCAGRPEKGMPAWCALGLDMSKINDIYQYVKGRSDAKIGPGRPAVKPQG
jgi:cbb3-type cytochrome c oxidase subunit III